MAITLPGCSRRSLESKSDNEYRRKYGQTIKEEIEKIPASERKDFRAKDELLDPERKEE